MSGMRGKVRGSGEMGQTEKNLVKKKRVCVGGETGKKPSGLLGREDQSARFWSTGEEDEHQTGTAVFGDLLTGGKVKTRGNGRVSNKGSSTAITTYEKMMRPVARGGHHMGGP